MVETEWMWCRMANFRFPSKSAIIITIYHKIVKISYRVLIYNYKPKKNFVNKQQITVIWKEVAYIQMYYIYTCWLIHHHNTHFNSF
jgi:hypothetical protein